MIDAQQRVRQPGSAPTPAPAIVASVIVVVRIVGDVDRAYLDHLDRVCLDVFAGGAPVLVLDFAALTGCPSALFLRVLRLNALARDHHTRLVVVHLTQGLGTVIGSGG